MINGDIEIKYLSTGIEYLWAVFFLYPNTNPGKSK